MNKILLAILAFIALTMVGYGGMHVYSTLTAKPHTAQANGQIQQATAQAVEPTKTKYELDPPTAEELLELVNAERAKVGVAPLVIDERVQRSAQLKADDMAANNYLSHVMPSTGKVLSPEMNDLLVSACTSSSENYNWGTGGYRTAASAMSGWMNSKPHHDAILKSDYSLTGFGIAWGEKMIVVEHFCIAR